MAGNGSRSRSGCFACRKRRRRCPENKPICASCSKVGTECIYPGSQLSTSVHNFIIASSPNQQLLPTRSRNGKYGFLNLRSDELASICPEYQSSPTDVGHLVTTTETLAQGTKLYRALPPVGVRQMTFDESALIQYYAEIIASSRVYVHNERNNFQSSVMPVVLTTKGPLLSAVLALSAAEWDRNVGTVGNDYGLLSSSCKVKAIQELQRALNSGANADENLLTCVLLATLEIADGSRPTWLTHLQGAFAILDQFKHQVDPSTAQFVLTYFRFRYILMETTRPSANGLLQRRVSNAEPAAFEICSEQFDDSFWSTSSSESSKETAKIVDESLGCPTELVESIEQIARISSAVSDSDTFREDLFIQANLIDKEVTDMKFAIRQAQDDYLLQSAEAFRAAIQIYLRLVCFAMPTTHQSILTLHKSLIDVLSEIIIEDQIRRSFPMWPLFIAGCACSSDEQRKAVLEFYTTVDKQWPISNISTVWAAVRTVWQSRDLSPNSSSLKQRDWQDIIHRFGWKLSLT
ncbi:hypothetical protein BU24DRAFT_453964 [Aaosphaeria arxii CBS 175.79]|uniref:Zn(2)-C6 fungal-type domain-containing protein n=1 Tax=Aaosphaeria arxii CBS 175.79 TaxID=1450172 RepID=A0A6A5XE26_9PLEO|nr:uncharacterized protein BU24DRAFT_453964 [Aaosphaeria arxii CBS 175.79]KAF2011405.1 hypothetical protein BU24DRAFT_453964 [Aaosphaeria arxii CBS 175.79]